MIVAAASLAVALAAAPSPTRLQVTANEFDLTLSRQRVRSGRAVIELVNFGEDDHDLRVRRFGRRSKSRYIPVTLPRERGELELRLRPGRYRLWCSIADHRELGMEALLVVRKKKWRKVMRSQTTVTLVPVAGSR